MKNIYAILSLALLFILVGTTTGQNVVYWEEFNGSANGWVSEPVAPLDSSFWNWADNNWQWSATGDVGTGAFFNTQQDSTINSETAANGSMVFNADYYTTQGNPSNYPPSGPPYVQYVCNLTSPNIDLSAVTAPVQLEFNQNLRFLNVSSGAPGGFRVSVSWSTDNGVTWSAPADAGEGQNVNQYGNASAVKTFPMTGVQGSPNLLIRFTWSSDFYYWCIDDVKIVERPANDMRVNDNWYAVAPNLYWPLDMVEPFSFLADIQNLGSEPQTNVNLNITIEDEGSNVVYTEDLAYGTIGVDSTAENVPFEGAGFTPTDIGVYTGTYTVSSDSTDFNLDDNSLSFEFLITDTLFAKDNGVTTTTRPANSSWDVDEPWSWAYGNYYYVPQAGNYLFGHVFFSLDVSDNPDLAGENLTVRVYKWNDDNEDEAADPAERNPVATMIYTINGTETSGDDLIALPVTTLLGDPVALEDNTQYIVAVEFQTDISGKTIDMGMSRAVDYGAQILRSQLGGAARYGSFLGVLGNLDEEPYSSLGFGYDFVPVVRVSIVEPSNTKEVLNAAEILNISPNPANDFVQFDVKLKETSSNIRVEMLDLTGKSLGMKAFQNTNVVNTTFNTSNLANGTYLVRIDTDFGYTTELFVVQK